MFLQEKDALKRAELMLQEAEKLKAREFITAQDVIDGKQTLNMAYVLEIFMFIYQIVNVYYKFTITTKVLLPIYSTHIRPWTHRKILSIRMTLSRKLERRKHSEIG